MSSAGDPYQPPRDPAMDRPPRGKNTSTWIWIVILGVVVGLPTLIIGGAVLTCCGGGAGLVYFGLDVVAEQVADDLRDHPVIQEQLGGIDEIDVDFTASAAADGDEEFVFKVKGPKGSGTLTARTISTDDGREQVERATLRTDKGTFEIVPQ